ncbi:competence/damage-inducible protein A [Thalassobacillus sp. CUG 92003]|uniref:competence/damage-inducible protein A n=1 Tax=Thalassobacillus sp. CUG 92003 TaxID=2736641 RepID=UPI0015E797BF|nr:competence/damage-inducible protein A [Thalassobacillus sp. CUG 92003]
MSQGIHAEIIAVGTELLLGQIPNTNAQWISKRLVDDGFHVYFHGVVGDNEARAFETFSTAQERSKLVIVTGGLGPTEDDLTRDVAQRLFGQSLVEDEKSMARIETYYERNQKPMSPNNRKQSLVFEHADVLDNQEGMAPGMIVEHEGTLWVFLPGVPSEMKKLMLEDVRPYLKDYYAIDSEIVSEMLHFIGIGESKLEHELHDVIEQQTNPTVATLAHDGEVSLRLTAKGDTHHKAVDLIEDIKHEILDRVGDFYYGSDDLTIQEIVLELLTEQERLIGSAESLTGGLFMEELIATPGASAVCQGSIVAYNQGAKHNLLQVPEALMDEFGTVSEQCAASMATNGRDVLSTDITLSFTGVAGPDPSEGKEPGVVFIGLQIGNEQPQVYHYHFPGTRPTIRRRAVKKAYELLYHTLKSN